MKLGIKLIAVSLALSLIPLFSILYLTNDSMRDIGESAEADSGDALMDQIEQQLNNEAAARQEEIQTFVDERESDAKSLSSLYAIERYFTARAGDDLVGNTMGQKELENGVEGWEQTIQDYVSERGFDAKTLSTLHAIDRYFNARSMNDVVGTTMGQEELENGVEGWEQTIQDYISERGFDAKTLATLHAIDRYFNARAANDVVGTTMGQKELENGVEGWQQTIKNYIAERGFDAKILAKTDSIYSYFNDSSNNSINTVEQYFTDFQLNKMIEVQNENIDIYCHLTLTDANGMELACTEEGSVVTDTTINHSTKQWFIDASVLNEDEVVYSDVMAEVMESGETEDMMHITAPVYCNNQFTGVIDLRSHYFIISMMLEPVVYGDTGFLFIINEDGVLVSHPQYSISDNIDISNPTNSVELATIVNNDMLIGETGFGTYTDSTGAWYLAYAPLSIGGDTYSIAATVPVSELNAIALSESQNAIEDAFVNFQLSKMIDVHEEIIDIYCHLTLTDETGMELICTEEGTVVTDTTKDHSSEQWFITASASNQGEIVYSDVMAEVMENGQAEDMIHIASPVYCNGDFVGVVDLRSHYFIISMMIEPIVYGDTGFLFIINGDGILVSHPEYSIADNMDTSNPSNGAELAAVVNNYMLNGQTGFDTYTSSDTAWYIAYAPLNVGSDAYSIAATVPVPELNAIALNESQIAIQEAFVNFQLSKMIEVHDEIIDIYCHLTLTDETGMELICTEEGTVVTDITRNHSTEQWFITASALNDGEIVYSDVMAETMESGEAEDMIHISAPIFSNGEFAGVVDLRSHYFIISMMIEPVLYGETGYLFIINEDGVVVSHPQYSISDDMDISNPANGAELAAIVNNNMVTGQTGFNTYTDAGEEYYIAYAPLSVGNDQYSIAATVPLNELNDLALNEAYNALVNTFRSFQMNKLLVIAGETYDLYCHLTLTDATGNELICTEEGTVVTDQSRNYSTTPWFTSASALEEGNIVFSDVAAEVMEMGDTEDMIHISAPIYNSGEFVGVVDLRCHYFIISDIISQVTIGKTGYVYIINEDGVLVSHPDYSISDNMDISNPANGEDLANIVDNHMLNGETGFGDYSFENTNYYAAFAPLTVGDDQYTIAVSIPVDEAEESAHKLGNSIQDKTDSSINMSLLIVGIVVAIVIVISFVFARAIIKPVNQVAKNSKSLAEGDFGAKLEIKAGDDEIGELVASYQGMLANTAGPLRELNQVAQAIADGDLTKDIKVVAKGEIDDLAKSFMKMLNNLRVLVSDIKLTSGSVSATSQELASSAEEMNASTQQVSSAIQQISRGSQSQANQVESTANVMKEMSGSVKDVANRAKSSADSSQKMNETANAGRKSVLDAVSKMKEIHNVVNESANTIEGLGKRSEEISQIVDVITNITDQTNLLALNAAIEAARAGEHGRGFAVVAEEVKNLAEDSKEAAERIANMIKEIQDDTNKAVEVMQHGTKEVEEGISVVNTTDKSFEEITQIATLTNDEIQAISVATEQQLTGTSSIAKSIDDIASIAEETASASEESASSTEELTASMEDMTARAQELSEMAISLQRSVSKFMLEEEKLDRINNQESEEPEFKPTRKKVKTKVNKLKLPDKVAKSLEKRGIETKMDAENKDKQQNLESEEMDDFESKGIEPDQEGINYAE
jgi:methyl-accepting chemotaxis protein